MSLDTGNVSHGDPLVTEASGAVVRGGDVDLFPSRSHRRPVRVGGTVNEHEAAACVTANDWPAIVSVAVRAAPVLAAAATVTDPLPVPLPPVTVIHDGAPVVVHVHAAVVVTPTAMDSPAAVGLKLVGLMLYVHGAACVTVNDCPRWSASRAGGVCVRLTAMETDPSGAVPPLTVIHAALRSSSTCILLPL